MNLEDERNAGRYDYLYHTMKNNSTYCAFLYSSFLTITSCYSPLGIPVSPSTLRVKENMDNYSI